MSLGGSTARRTKKRRTYRYKVLEYYARAMGCPALTTCIIMVVPGDPRTGMCADTDRTHACTCTMLQVAWCT
eukprot:2170906-Rhodomonas_salina.4